MLKLRMYTFILQEIFQEKSQKMLKDKTLTSELNSLEIS